MSGNQLIQMRGLPGSGKSTWAKDHVNKRQGWIRISNDELRLAFFNRAFSKPDTKYIEAARKNLIEFSISQGLSIVVDNCNLHPKHFDNYSQIAKDNGYKFLVQDFTDVPLAECIARDKKRPNKVGAWVILDMYNHFLKPEGTEPIKSEHLPSSLKAEIKHAACNRLKQDKQLPKAIICDLDGTMALIEHRNPFDASNCNEDELNEAVHAAVMAMKAQGCQIIFASGRMDKYSRPTREFIRDKVGMNDNEYLLFMRKTDDFRKDFIIKEEIYHNFIEGNFYVEFVLDDRDSVVSLWRNLGLSCFQVNYGNF